jgi:hypothetical protein
MLGLTLPARARALLEKLPVLWEALPGFDPARQLRWLSQPFSSSSG